MDPLVYKNEIDRLTKEISTLKDSSDTPSTSSAYNILSYKYYFLVVLILGISIYLVKPKCVLTIHIDESDDESEPQIVLSKKYFAFCWLFSSLVGCLIYFLYQKYRKD